MDGRLGSSEAAEQPGDFFGGLFGVVGMVIGVPVFATLYGLAQEFIHAMLDRRGIDADGNAVAEEIPDEDNVFE